MSGFWVSFLEFVYLPIQTFIGYDCLISSIVLLGFVIFQFWLIYICVVKPFVMCFNALTKLMFGGYEK